MQKQEFFTAKDANGKEERLVLTTNYKTFTALDGDGDNNPVAMIPRLTTALGKSVNRLEKGKYQVVQTGVILTSDDPKAI